jgi:integrase
MASIIKRAYWATLPNGQRVRRQCEHYTIEYRDPGTGRKKRVKGYRDKGATKQLAAKLESALARGEQGLVDPFKAHKARPLTEHVKDWLAHLRTAGRSAKYVSNAEYRMTVLIDGCGWRALPEIDANSFTGWRERQKGQKRKGVRGDRVGTSAATLNQYLDTARAFLNWCVSPMKRLAVNPLASVCKVEGAKVRRRRALSDEEVARLLTAAPEARRLVYRVALAAGLRRGELAALQWGDLRITATRPAIQLRAEATKARRGDRVPLPHSLAADLRAARPDDATDAGAVFPAVPGLEEWKDDLVAAGIPYADAMGRQADFHAGTRKTLCTRMHRGNVPLATAMRIMRHTDARLTMVDYADDEQLGTDADALPEVPQAPASPAQASEAKAGG